MAGIRNYVDMRRTMAEKVEDILPPSISEMPDVAPGLCLCLTEDELEKQDIDVDTLDVGDVIHMAAFAKITSISKHDREAGSTSRVELSIVQLAIEDESVEVESGDEDDD